MIFLKRLGHKVQENKFLRIESVKKPKTFLQYCPKSNGGVSRKRVCGCDCWCYWQVKGDTQYATRDTWHMTSGTWQMKDCSFFLPFCLFRSVFVSVLLSAHIERFSVSAVIRPPKSADRKLARHWTTHSKQGTWPTPTQYLTQRYTWEIVWYIWQLKSIYAFFSFTQLISLIMCLMNFNIFI